MMSGTGKKAEIPYFSIVMPVYNGEKYFSTMLRSIEEQTFTDWELIIINDASSDKSLEIAEKFSEEDARVRVISFEENQGVSSARNRGITEARGHYIWFADADDRVENDLLEKVWESLKHNPAQVVVFGLIEEHFDSENEYLYSHRIAHAEKTFRSREELRPELIYLERETLYGYLWNKVYNLAYLKQQRFQFAPYEKAKFIEDIKFNIEYCMDIDSMNILEITPYHYAKRMQNNLTNEFVPDYFKFHRQRIEMLLKQYKYWNLCTEEVCAILGSLYARYILSTLQRNCDSRAGMSHAQRRYWCKRLFGQEMFCELIPQAKAKDSIALKIAIECLKRKWTFGCLGMGRGIYMARNLFPAVFSKIKAKR